MARALLNLAIGCRFDHLAEEAVPAVAIVEPHSSLRDAVADARWEGPVGEGYEDVDGNNCRRLVLPPGASWFSYSATVSVPADPDETPGPSEIQHRIEDLPVRAAALASAEPVLRVRHARRPGLGAVRQRRRAVSSGAGGLRLDPREHRVRRPSCPDDHRLEMSWPAQGGMCRDFAHLGVTFCRALGIPARYVSGYLPRHRRSRRCRTPTDFHAWFEVWLGERAGGRSTRASTRRASAGSRSGAAATRATSRW